MKISGFRLILCMLCSYSHAENICEYFENNPTNSPLNCKTIIDTASKLYSLNAEQALHCEQHIKGCQYVSHNQYIITLPNTVIKISGKHFLSAQQSGTNNSLMVNYDITPNLLQLIITNIKLKWQANKTDYQLYWDNNTKEILINSKSLGNYDITYTVIKNIANFKDYDLHKQYKCKVKEEYSSTCFNAQDSYECKVDNISDKTCIGFNTAIMNTINDHN